MLAAAECIPTKVRAKHSSMRDTSSLGKWDNVRTAFLCNKRNPTNANSETKEGTKRTNKCIRKKQVEYIQGQTNKIINLVYCTPYIMDSLSFINTRQWSSPELIQTHVTQSRET